MATFTITSSGEIIAPDVFNGAAGSDWQQRLLRIPAMLRRVTAVTRLPTAEILP